MLRCIFFVILLTAISATGQTSKSSCIPTEKSITVHGTSMEPRYKNNQDIKYLENFYQCAQFDVQRGDIVVFEIPGRKNFLLKKVVAIPNDKFEYKNQNIYINGLILKNSEKIIYKIDSKMLALYAKDYPTIPEKSYLVLGDNTNGTFDASRFGLISSEQIKGKVK